MLLQQQKPGLLTLNTTERFDKMEMDQDLAASHCCSSVNMIVSDFTKGHMLCINSPVPALGLTLA